jgi:hypothetical protein
LLNAPKAKPVTMQQKPELLKNIRDFIEEIGMYNLSLKKLRHHLLRVLPN